MMARVSDGWLDSLARRSVRLAREPRPPAASASNRRVEAEAVVDARRERYSRATAVKLAIVGAASLSFGLGRVEPSYAQSRHECILQCYDKYEQAAERDIAACKHLYSKPAWAKHRSGWKRLTEVFKAGGWSFANDVITDALRESCITRAGNQFKRGLDRCDDACEETCPNPLRRTPQSSSASRQVCRAPDPPPPHTPKPPPPPNASEDPCFACNRVGGQCCGPFASNSDGSFRPCTCATPGVPCEVYGCGG